MNCVKEEVFVVVAVTSFGEFEINPPGAWPNEIGCGVFALL